MAKITVSITMERTVDVLNATTIQAILVWIQTNIKDKLPSDTSLVVTLNLIP